MSSPRKLSDLVRENNLPEIKKTIQQIKEKSFINREDKRIIATAVRDAILLDKVDIVQSIMKEKLHIADVRVPLEDKKYSDEKPLIYYAVQSKSLPIVKILVEAKASLKKMGSEGNGTNDEGIRNAVKMGVSDIAEYLLEQGALTSGVFEGEGFYRKERETFLGMAANQQDHKMAEVLTKFDIDRENTIDLHYERYISRLKRLSDKESETKNYQQSTKFLLDYAMGMNFNSSRSATYFHNLEFLSKIDISNFNFIGLSLDGQPITKEILKSKKLTGAENAITTLDDLERLLDVNRKSLIKTNLERAYKQQGKLVKNGTVNLVPLGDAIQSGDKDAVEVRLKAGISPNLKYFLGYRSFSFGFEKNMTLPIFMAVITARKDIVQLLIDHPFFDKGSLSQAIQIAKQIGRMDIVEELDKVRDLNEQDEEGNTLLHLSARIGDVATVKEFIRRKANLNLINKNNKTALDIVAGHARDRKNSYQQHLSSEDIEIIRLLVEAKADANIGKNDTALNLAAESGSYEAMKLLLPVTTQNEYKYTSYVKGEPVQITVPWYVPLMFDSYCDSDEWINILKLLITHHADLNAKKIGGQTILMSLLQRVCPADNEKDFLKHLDQIKFLLEQGALPNTKSDNDDTALHLLFRNFNSYEESPQFIQIVDLFIKNGFSINDASVMRGYLKETLLELAVAHNQIKMIDYLLSKNIDINLTGNQGRTALHWAVKYPRITKLLIHAGADIDARDDKGLTPFQFSEMCIQSSKDHSFTAEKYRLEFIAPYQESQSLLKSALRHQRSQLLREKALGEQKEYKSIPIVVKKRVSDDLNNITLYDLSQFSEYTKVYIQSFGRIEKNSSKIKRLALSQDEEKKLSKGIADILTKELPDIPVRLNEKLYDLSTLVQLPKKEDPFTRLEFKLEHIVPARDVQAQLDSSIKEFEAEKNKLKVSAAILKSEKGPQLLSKKNKENDLAMARELAVGIQKENDLAVAMELAVGMQKENDIAARGLKGLGSRIS